MTRLITLCCLLLLLAAPCLAQTQITFAWDLSADDGQLGPGGGYRIYASKQDGVYGSPAGSVAPGIATMTIATPGLGRWYFVARAFLADGTESDNSNTVSQVLKPKAPKVNTVQQVAQAMKKGVTAVAGLFKGKKNLRIIE